MAYDGSMSIVLYGIPNCDTVKKARAWLTGNGVAYQFHDFKKQGVPAERLDQWIAQCGWERLVNRQGTTWRKLDTKEQGAVTDAAAAKLLMRAHASVKSDRWWSGATRRPWASTRRTGRCALAAESRLLPSLYRKTPVLHAPVPRI
jgi:arsenate reductase